MRRRSRGLEKQKSRNSGGGREGAADAFLEKLLEKSAFVAPLTPSSIFQIFDPMHIYCVSLFEHDLLNNDQY